MAPHSSKKLERGVDPTPRGSQANTLDTQGKLI